MNLRETARRIKQARESIARFKAIEDRIYARLQQQIGLDDSDSIVFDYLFNGPGTGTENATVVAKLTRETQISEAPGPISKEG